MAASPGELIGSFGLGAVALEAVRRLLPTKDKADELRQQAVIEQITEANRFRAELRDEIKDLRTQVKELYRENRTMAEQHLLHREHCFGEIQTLTGQVAELMANGKKQKPIAAPVKPKS